MPPGFFFSSSVRHRSSIKAAPRSKPSISTPQRATGKSPAAERIEKRPLTFSGSGRVRTPSVAANAGADRGLGR